MQGGSRVLKYEKLSHALGSRPFSSVNYLAMRLVPFARPRRWLARCLSACVNLLQRRPREAALGAGRAEPVLSALTDRGIARLPALLRPSQIADIRAYLRKSPTMSREGTSFDEAEAARLTARASYPIGTIVDCPHLIEVVNRPDLLAIVSSYLGCKPTISSIGVHWSFPQAPGAEDLVQHFHRDPDDWRILKLFIYLTNVDEASGPHEYVEGTHRTSGRILSNIHTDGDVERRFPGRMSRVTGPAGTSFLGDTWGVHRGPMPLSKPRLAFQVQYSIFPIVRYRYGPMPPARELDVDRYVNRCLVT